MSNQIVITSGAKVRSLEGVLTGTSGVVNSLPINTSNGIPQLDSNGKILVSQLPNSVMEYKGTWNVATNTPYLVNGVGNQGDVYLVEGAATTGTSHDFGAGAITFYNNDQAIYSGSIWQRASGATGSVTSVGLSTNAGAITIGNSPITTSGVISANFNGTNLQYVNGAGNLTTFPTLMTSVGLTMPSAFTVTNSPLTGTGGTLAVTGAGTTSQYIDGTGALQTFPALTGYVPYTGATTDVDLGTHVLNAQALHVKGTAGAGHLGLKHQTASPTGSANESLIFADVNGNLGWQNDNLYLTTLVSNANTANRSYTFPNASGTLALTSDISYPVTSVFGRTGAVTAQSGDYTTTLVTEGTRLYYTDTRARAALSFTAGSGAYNSTTGVITIPTNTSQLTNGANFITLASLSAGTGISYNNLTGVISSTITQYTDAMARAAISGGTGISYNSTTGVITNTITQYTDALARAAISLTTTGTSGAATYNSTTGVLNIPQYTDAYTGTVTSVAMTVPTGLSVSGSPITTSGTLAVTLTAGYSIPTTASQTNWDTAYTNRITSATSPLSITSNVISISQATTSTSGYLSSTDWNTFNSKQGTITLTTTGSSGAATLVSNTLNIPNYTLSGLGGIGGSGTANYLPKFTAGTTIGNSLVYDSGSVVAIGTTSNLGGGRIEVVDNGTSAYTSRSATSSASNGGTNAISLRTVDASASYWANAYYDAWSHVFRVSGGTTALTLNSSGNLGLGVTPSAWSGNWKAIQLNGGSIFNYLTSEIHLGQNFYYSTSAIANYQNNGFASDYWQYNGQHIWMTAPSGTAGSAISFTQAMTLFANGGLGLNTTTPTVSTGYQTFSISGSTGAQIEFQTSGTGKAYIYSNSTDLRFYTNGGAFRFENTTGLEVGYTAAQGLYKLDVNGTGRFSDGTQGLIVRSYTGGAGYGAIYASTLTPNGSNPALIASSTSTFLNANTGGNVYLSIGTVAALTIASTGAATFASSVSVNGATITKPLSIFAPDATGNIRLTRTGTSEYMNISTFNITVSGNDLQIQSGTGNTLQLNPSGSNVLIGTTTDAGYKLDVNGTGRFSGAVYIGTTPATSGAGLALAIPFDNAIRWRNSTNTANYGFYFGSSNLFYTDAGLTVGGEIGISVNASVALNNISGSISQQLQFRNNGTNKFQIYLDVPNNSFNIFNSAQSVNNFSIASSGAATFSSTIKTGATSYGAGAVKFGIRNAGSATGAGGYMAIEIDGTTYFLNLFTSTP